MITPHKSKLRSSDAYTLLELLVVVGLIVLFAALIAPALTSRDQTLGLRAAEANVGGLLIRARNEAILKRRPVRVIVAMDASDRTNYLRSIALASRRDDASPWTVFDVPTMLPETVRVVPSGAVDTVDGVSWPSSARSVFGSTDTQSVIGFEATTYGYFEFSVTGATLANRQLMVSPVKPTAEGAKFYLPNQLRVYLLRGTGNYALLRDAEGG